jgi:hypothetical protein
MAGLLSLPPEVRAPILRRVLSRDVRICSTDGTSYGHDHKRLRNPNLSLLLVCHKIKQEIEALARYRFITRSYACAVALHRRLSPGVLRGSQVVLSDFLLQDPLDPDDPNPSVRDYMDYLKEQLAYLRPKWKRQFLEDSGKDSDSQGRRLIDWVFEF